MPPRREPRAVFVGLATLDFIAHVATELGPNVKTHALAHELVAGGPATNAAIAFAALGGRATLITALGRHPLSQVIREDLAANRVELLDVAPLTEDQPPVASITVNRRTAERSVVLAAAPEPAAPGPAMGAAIAAAVRDADALLIDGHHARVLRAVLQRVAPGVDVIADLGSWKDSFDEALSLVDVAACSADLRDPAVPQARGAQLAQALRARGADQVVITRGPQPVEWWSAGAEGTVPVPAVAARDTLGAGDAFHGAITYARAVAPTLSLEWQIEFAVAVAAIRVCHEGQRSYLNDPELHRLAASASE